MAQYVVFIPGFEGNQIPPNTAILSPPVTGTLWPSVTAASAAAALAVITATPVGTSRPDLSHTWLASAETTG